MEKVINITYLDSLRCAHRDGRRVPPRTEECGWGRRHGRQRSHLRRHRLGRSQRRRAMTARSDGLRCHRRLWRNAERALYNFLPSASQHLPLRSQCAGAPERKKFNSLTWQPRGIYCIDYSSRVAMTLGRFRLTEVSPAHHTSV